jgi:hypothetical protein
MPVGTVFAGKIASEPFFMSRILNDNADTIVEMETNTPETVPDAMPGKTACAKSRVCIGLFYIVVIGSVLALGWFSFNLAATRIYQVDECCNVFVTQLLKTGKSGAADLFQIVLSWLMPASNRSADLYASARVLMVLVFWLNWILLASATGEKMFSRRWLVALLGAATLAPLWDYGFEVRHDNVLLAGVLLMWTMIRFKPPEMSSYFVVGFCALGLQFVAFKAFVYTMPISLAVLVFPPPGRVVARWKLILSWCLGAVAAFFVARLIFKLGGVGKNYLATVDSVAAIPGQQMRFWPFDPTLVRLLVQTPLLLALAVAAVAAFLGEVVRRWRVLLDWKGNAPEVALCGIALVALFINPNPYPYNLISFVPYVFLLTFRYGMKVWEAARRQVVFVPIAAAVIVFAHFVPFGMTTKRHLVMTNFNQERIMDLAENLTDPDKDTIFDGVGMIPTRQIFDERAFLHGQVVHNFISGPGPRIHELLAAKPATVVILSGRTDWLPEEDQEFIRSRYVSIGDALLVPGKILPGGGTFEVFHAGRYRVTPAEASNLAGTYREPKNFNELVAKPPKTPPLTGTLDGKPISDQPVELSVGTHHLECPPDRSAAVAWVGPRMDSLPKMYGYDHRFLFVNWY